MNSNKLRLATFNANSIRMRLAGILDWLSQNSPDVLCIQETKVVDELFPRAEIEDACYHVVFKGQKSYNGVAIICRKPPGQVLYGFDKLVSPEEARFIAVNYDGVWIINTYVPQGQSIESPKYAMKLAWLQVFREYLDTNFTPDTPLIWTGDINVAHLPLDLHSPKTNKNHVCYHEEVRNAFEQVISFGLVDVFRRHNPEGGHYTFWDYRIKKSFENNLGWRIDHILATPLLTERCIACWIDREPRGAEKPSDHTYLLADFDTNNMKV